MQQPGCPHEGEIQQLRTVHGSALALPSPVFKQSVGEQLAPEGTLP